MPRSVPVLLVLVLAVAGCGGGGDRKPDRFSLKTPKQASPPAGEGTASPSPTVTPAPRRVTARERAIVKGWADALRRGDVDRAIAYWRIPATAWNGVGSPIRLTTRAAIRFWNESLPCGAKLESVERDGNYVLATFVLTERPGKGRCGSGTGHRARTAFLVRGGRIIQWIRAPDPPSPKGQTS
jgi:limonene-1,2-epoxide hydrolase